MDIFYALAEPRRRQVIEILASRGQRSATEICDEFDVSPQAISQHLKVLREAKVVQMEKRAQQRLYQINPSSMLELEEWTDKVTQLWTKRFDALDKVLAGEKEKILKEKRGGQDE